MLEITEEPAVGATGSHRSALPPGPRSIPSLQVLKWTFTPGPFMEQCQRKYGDIFTLRLDIGRRISTVCITDPDLIRNIFRDRDLTTVGYSRESLSPLFGRRSVLLVDGPEHRRQRKVLTLPFHGKYLEKHKEVILAATDNEIDQWPLNKPFALGPRIYSIAFEIILKAIFGLNEFPREARIRKCLDRITSLTGGRAAVIGTTLPNRIGPINLQAPILHLRKEFDAALREEIALRRDDPGLEDRSDAFSLFLLARDEDGNQLTDQEICDNLITLLLAGYETSSTTFSWSVDHVLHDPESHGKLAAESRDPSGDGQYAEAVLNETLRLEPPLSLVTRTLSSPIAINDYRLPEGTIIAPCVYLLQRSPDLYPPDPEIFRPDRFVDQVPDRNAWIPFGGGDRKCLGANFARFQMKVILSRLFERTELRAVSPHREKSRRRGLFPVPARGVRVVLEKRREA